MTGRVWVGLGVWVVASFVIALIIAPKANDGFADEAAVLTFAGLSAVGIERLLEFFWTLVGNSRLGGWWPLKQLVDAIATVEAETNRLVGPAFETTRDTLSQVRSTLEDGSDAANEIDAELAKLPALKAELEERLAAARRLAPGSERMAMTASIASVASNNLAAAADVGREAAADARTLISNAHRATTLAMEVAESFADNPARRMASILLGGGLGMLASGLLGLNIFLAVLGADSGWLGAGIGVALTGFVVGLGSSPTHELVKALQNYKESRQPPVDAPTREPGPARTDPRRMTSERLHRLARDTAFLVAPRAERQVVVEIPDPETRTFRLRRTH